YPSAMEHRTLQHLLEQRFAAAIQAATGQTAAGADALIRASNEDRFGDYQCNAALPLAKALQRKPRDIAAAIMAAVDLAGIAGPLEIGGPGFINIRLTNDFLGQLLAEIPPPPTTAPALPGEMPDRMGIPPITTPQRVVVDYSSPNIAK